VLAVAAVARPGTFSDTVRDLVFGSVELAAFGDHHEYTRSDVEQLRRRAGERPIVVTEKDAVKLLAYREVLGEAYVLEQELRWDWGEAEVTDLLTSVTRAVTT
jgi:tetraacyldisaccharide 4'-kinase